MYTSVSCYQKKQPPIEVFDLFVDYSIKYVLLVVVAPIMIWNCYRLNAKHRDGIVYSVLKSYFKRYNVLVCIALVDIFSVAMFNLECMYFENLILSKAVRVTYQIIILFEIYLLIALINIKQVRTNRNR